MINKLKKNSKSILLIILALELIIIIYLLRLNVANYYYERNIYRNSYFILENQSIDDKRAEKLLGISKYFENGVADFYYMHAFDNYLFNINKYSEMQLDIHGLINKNTFKLQEASLEDIINIIEGSKKKTFNGWLIYKKHIQQNNNLWFVFNSFASIMLEKTEKEWEEKKYESFFLLAKATYSYLSHFQKLYPDRNIMLSASEAKLRLMEILIKYYCSSSNTKNCDESIIALYYYQYANENNRNIIQGLIYQNYIDHIITSDNSYAYAIMNIILYDIDDIDNIYDLAKNKYYISINFESMKVLSIMSHSYWHPIKSYKARKALNLLELNQDLAISELAKIAEKRNLLSFLSDTFDYAKQREKIINESKKKKIRK